MNGWMPSGSHDLCALVYQSCAARPSVSLTARISVAVMGHGTRGAIT